MQKIFGKSILQTKGVVSRGTIPQNSSNGNCLCKIGPRHSPAEAGGQNPGWVLTYARYRINPCRDSAPCQRPAHHGPRPAASCARARDHAPRTTASWARPAVIGPPAGPGTINRDYRPAGPASWATGRGAQAIRSRTTERGPRRPVYRRRWRTLKRTRVLFIGKSIMYGRERPGFIGEKKPGHKGRVRTAQLGRTWERVKRAREFSRLRFQNQRDQRSIESSAHMRSHRLRRPRAFQSGGPHR